MIKVALEHGVQPRVEIATLEEAEYYEKPRRKTFLHPGSDGHPDGSMERNLRRC